jgi:hypothetical protein
MNHIKQLQADNLLLKLQTEAADDLIGDLFRYLQSDKFHCGHELDNYVNTADIQSRLQEIRNSLRSLGV